MTAPKLSIIIPAFNAENGILKTLTSIKVPEALSCEVIVIDDGSVDSTADIVSGIAENEPGLRLIRKHNAGVSAARNDGIIAANGEYVMFIDADDVLLEGALAFVAKNLLEFPDADIIAFGIRLSRYDGKRALETSDKVIGRTRTVVNDELELAIDELLRENYLQTACSKVYKTKFLDSNGLRFDKRLRSFEDLEFVLACLESGGNLVAVAEAIYEYRLGRGESGSRTAMDDMDRQMTLVRARINSFCAARSINEQLFNSLSAHLFVNAVNSLIVTAGPRRIFAERVSALRDCHEFSALFADNIVFPNKYSKLIFWAVSGGRWNLATFLALCRNAIRRRTGQPV